MTTTELAERLAEIKARLQAAQDDDPDPLVPPAVNGKYGPNGPSACGCHWDSGPYATYCVAHDAQRKMLEEDVPWLIEQLTLYACVEVLASGVSSLPMKVSNPPTG